MVNLVEAPKLVNLKLIQATFSWCNSSTSRNLFYFEGYLMLLQEYSKPRNQTKRDSYIPRFLPKQLAELLVLYLDLLKPLQYRIMDLSVGKEKALAAFPFMFTSNGKAMDPSKFATLFSKFFKEFSNLDNFGISNYRQLSSYIADTLIHGIFFF